MYITLRRVSSEQTHFSDFKRWTYWIANTTKQAVKMELQKAITGTASMIVTPLTKSSTIDATKTSILKTTKNWIKLRRQSLEHSHPVFSSFTIHVYTRTGSERNKNEMTATITFKGYFMGSLIVELVYLIENKIKI